MSDTTLIQEHLSLLGKKVRCRVTAVEGTVASVCFDLYGCVQAIVNRGLDKDGKFHDQVWFDVNRLEVLDHKPVMIQPSFVAGPSAEGKKGPAERPAFLKP